MVRFTVPTWRSDSMAGAHLLTWATLPIEAAIPVLVWNRRTRPWVLCLRAALHLGIDLTLKAGAGGRGSVLGGHPVWSLLP